MEKALLVPWTQLELITREIVSFSHLQVPFCYHSFQTHSPLFFPQGHATDIPMLCLEHPCCFVFHWHTHHHKTNFRQIHMWISFGQWHEPGFWNEAFVIVIAKGLWIYIYLFIDHTSFLLAHKTETDLFHYTVWYLLLLHLLCETQIICSALPIKGFHIISLGYSYFFHTNDFPVERLKIGVVIWHSAQMPQTCLAPFSDGKKMLVSVCTWL